jgi:hypothetical protein
MTDEMVTVLLGTNAITAAVVFCYTVMWCTRRPKHRHNFSSWEIVTMVSQFAWEKEGRDVACQQRQCQECGYVEIERMVAK